MLADKRRSRGLEGWLRGLFEYWRARAGWTAQLDAGTVKRLQAYLRPDVAGAPAGDAGNAGDAGGVSQERCPRPDRSRG